MLQMVTSFCSAKRSFLANLVLLVYGMMYIPIMSVTDMQRPPSYISLVWGLLRFSLFLHVVFRSHSWFLAFLSIAVSGG